MLARRGGLEGRPASRGDGSEDSRGLPGPDGFTCLCRQLWAWHGTGPRACLLPEECCACFSLSSGRMVTRQD